MELHKEQLVTDSMVSLANANAVVSGIVMAIAGNDISTSIGENTLTTEMVSSLVQSRIAERLSGAK